jgi:hypothetical protein
MIASLLTVVAALVARPSKTSAQAPPPPAPCNAWDVEYTLAANLQLRDTPMGAGNGVYRIGPGTMVLRFEDRGGQPGGVAKMVSYTMRENFQIRSRTVFWTTTVVTDTRTNATAAGACPSAGEGNLIGRTLRWSTPIRGYHTDGTLTCEGNLCGSFGAPPPGTSELHIAAHDVQLSPFEFGPDMKTFTMAHTFVSKTESPKQTAYMTLAGREVRRSCAACR